LGNITGGVHGLYVRDCRYISQWELRLGGHRPKLLSSHHVDFFSNLCFLANGDASGLPPNSISLVRRRVVGNGMEEEWELTNHEHRTLTVPLELRVAADFLDLFDVKAQEFAAMEDHVFTDLSTRRPVRRRVTAGTSPTLVFSHTDGEYQGRAELSTSPPPHLVGRGGMSWRLVLKAHTSTRVHLKVRLKIQQRDLPITHDLSDFGRGADQLQGRLNRDRIVSPRLVTPWSKLQSTFQRSIADLGALLIEDPDISPGLPTGGLPAAGHPDFLTNVYRPVGIPGAGISHAIAGTGIIVGLASLIAIPIGVIGGIYLAEYGTGRWAGWVRLASDVLVGTPSIALGLFAYALLVVPAHHFSAISGSIALSILMLPVVVRTTESAVALIPVGLRESGLALGLPRWRVSLQLILPAATAGVVTGALLAVARAAGETAPLLFTTFGNNLFSTDPTHAMAALPLIVFRYALTPYKDLQDLAWGSAFVLVSLVLIVNLASRWILRRQLRMAASL